ncbi:SusD/RagB family nutrient-binding outer membrane lipoprotein [Chitinophaga qingshengii]|uniref:SusD/RagB family nutrient-binding outer membrane lipoprotein n=1 Tax=Chitinophaga qingshengii TaxID=1569794 RepID=A0ABR7TJE0_9BACT|nr:SusD/RagB family nutrient-binding outer membrane lipoprotein [Chitinophaga qingshengii]MBC9930606.1 SusD/RagB family nutrient-binding outer membrane lipoprotein [Chitinophaga qingshengii]
MKKIFIKSGVALAAFSLLLSACSKFEDLNHNPKVADETQVQEEFLINSSIINAQMNPDVAERSFVLIWKAAAHQQLDDGITSGSNNDGWSDAYYNQVTGWLTSIYAAVDVSEKKIKSGNVSEYTNNLLQVARIWRAYLLSEISDNYGPVAINGYVNGTNPDFASVKDVYYFALAELKDASAKLQLDLAATTDMQKLDPAYKYDFKLWQRYANSMRMRLAMRLSEVDAAKAKAEFEDAAAGNLLTDMNQTFQVQEKPGWDALTGVMSREWNEQLLSTTLENIYNGLGGVKTADQLTDAVYQPYIRPADWAGLQFTNHFPTTTNDPMAGFWFDGLPQTIDPRAYKAFIPAGDFANANFSRYPSYSERVWKETARPLMANDKDTAKLLEGKMAWNGQTDGDWGTKGTLNRWYGWPGAGPRMTQQFRTSASKRIFFAPWETYFLIAEASVRGWNVPMTGKAAYEKGISQNFEYWGVSQFVGSYLASTDFNMVGTSVSWDHVAEPPATHIMNFKNGYTGAAGTVAIKYPANNLYKGGGVKNDLLTKIITQKYIANMPWLPLEAWSDQRRLGLPFFETPIVEQPIPGLPALNNGNYMTANIKFYPQRIRYPSSMRNANGKGYDQAVKALGGTEEVTTPLWWAKQQ